MPRSCAIFWFFCLGSVLFFFPLSFSLTPNSGLKDWSKYETKIMLELHTVFRNVGMPNRLYPKVQNTNMCSSWKMNHPINLWTDMAQRVLCLKPPQGSPVSPSRLPPGLQPWGGAPAGPCGFLTRLGPSLSPWAAPWAPSRTPSAPCPQVAPAGGLRTSVTGWAHTAKHALPVVCWLTLAWQRCPLAIGILLVCRPFCFITRPSANHLSLCGNGQLTRVSTFYQLVWARFSARVGSLTWELSPVGCRAWSSPPSVDNNN